MPASTSVIRIAAALIVGKGGKLLLVRKRDTPFFIQAGGKIETFEEPVCTLTRELKEELGLEITQPQLFYLGRFYAPAANEPGWMIEAELFKLSIDEDVVPAAEIDVAVWVDPFGPIDLPLAPFTLNVIIPMYVRTYS